VCGADSAALGTAETRAPRLLERPAARADPCRYNWASRLQRFSGPCLTRGEVAAPPRSRRLTALRAA
jgi:hypothetical protein